MKKILKNRSLLTLLSLLAVFLVIILFQLYADTSVTEKRKKVSLIVYGDDAERWENLRQGADLVCNDKNADISMITMLTEDDVIEQEEIIERETADGADALIIAACNSKEIMDYLNSRKLKIPVMFIGSMNDDKEKKICICADDYQMGYDLGQAIVENESDIVTVSVISENIQRDSVALREKGLRDAIEGKVGRIISWSRTEGERSVNNRVFVQRALVSQATDIIVTLDDPTTDALLDALVNLNKHSKIYSISTSDKAVYNLYDKEVKTLVYPDEFSMGYLAAMYVLDRSDAAKRYSGKEIDYRVVRKENMYDEDNQALLFPFVN